MNWLYKMINGNNLSGPNLMISYNNAKLAQSSMNTESLTTLTDLLIGSAAYGTDNVGSASYGTGSASYGTPNTDYESGGSPYDSLPLATSYLYDAYGDPLLNTPPTTVDSEISGKTRVIPSQLPHLHCMLQAGNTGQTSLS
uniref:Uncharacterized protein n=1 Tax=Cacopsylla melanoneura TaxID=428564 RepID=A0A8D9FBN6_9HEMI